VPESAVSKEAGPVETSSPANGTNGKRGGAAGAEPGVEARTAAEPEHAVRPGPEKPRRRAGARLIALGLAVMVIGSLAAVAVDHVSLSPGTVRAQAAAWVAEQVSPDVTVSCDAVMCAALQAHGFPVSKLVVLGPTSPDPVPSVLVVETATVRELFGSSLAIAWAPAVLASFGSGTGTITVRVVAPHGAAAYQAALNADRAGSGPGHLPGRVQRAEPARDRRPGNVLTALLTSDRRSCRRLDAGRSRMRFGGSPAAACSMAVFRGR